jgi:hypothetical protein
MLSRAHRSLQRDTGNQKFVYEGQEYYCVPNTFSRDTSLVAGGWEGTVQFTLFVNASDFPAALTADMDTVSADDSGDLTADSDYPVPPTAGKKITFPAPPLPSREYRVFKRNVPAAGGVFELILGSPNR